MVKDGARSIQPCLDSLSWADEVVVLDTGSRDGTPALARKAGAQVRSAPWEGFSKTRNKGIRKLKGPWILVLDADESLESGAEEILREAAASGEATSFFLPRRTLFLGKPMLWGGWGRDRQLRFFRKAEAWFDEGKRVHEGAWAKSPSGELRTRLLHDSYPDLASYLGKMDAYTALAAQDLRQRRHPLPLLRLIFLPPWIFLRMAFLRLGVLDGWRGLLLAGLSSWNEALKNWRAL
jgi:glycosyltransferase involved in cell wall biosynthesis